MNMFFKILNAVLLSISQWNEKKRREHIINFENSGILLSQTEDCTG